MSFVGKKGMKQRAVNQQKQAWCLVLLLRNEAKRRVREKDSGGNKGND
jgi:hypothetical protein